MPKFKAPVEDFDMTFIERDSKDYRCTVSSKSHAQSVAHRKLRELIPPEMSPPGPPQLEAMDYSRDTSPTHLATESISDSNDSNIVDPPLPLAPPPPDQCIPPYNFFDDFIYQDFDDDDRLNPVQLDPEPPLDTPLRMNLTSKLSLSKPKHPPLPNYMWPPFPDKAHFLTHSLFNTAHIRFSRVQQEAILDWGREMGASQVPTLNSLHACQQDLKAVGGDGPRMFKSHSGNIYYVNPIDDMVKQDFSMAAVREHLKFYPNDGNGPCSEFWDGSKLAHGENRSQLTPMAMNGNTHYFIDETCRLFDGSLSVPSMFFRRGQDLWARGHQLGLVEECSANNEYRVVCESTEQALTNFRENCIQLRNIYPHDLVVTGGSIAYTLASHELREQADGRPVYSVPFVLFVDDVSGNVSKQWNKHWCAYTSNASLPREQMNKRSNIRFMATSQHASPLEMVDGICTGFKDAFEKMVVVYDAKQKREVLVRPYILVVTGDNPMQACECSNIGMKGSHFCRTCDVGGSNVHKASDAGYAEIFKPGTLRTTAGTIASIEEQYEAAFTSTNAEAITKLQRQTGVKDAMAEPLIERIVKQRQLLQKQRIPTSQITQTLRADFPKHGPTHVMNPLLLQNGLDIHLDTPTETLHTILLGIVKY
ncbi:hypothetical protein FRC06_000691 [Ceratobasidium sp. 370]|nr:hypothetical protein FRC06_000691 [Ceratobasidium sp. 370]